MIARKARETGMLLMLLAGGLSASPVVPGTRHLDDHGAGELLLSELNCVSCHAPGAAADRLGAKAAPELGTIGSRVASTYLARYIAAPQQTRPGATMPDALAGLPAAEKQRAAADLTAYLVSLSPGPLPDEDVNADIPAAGEKLFMEIGCAACHLPGAGSETDRLSLTHLAGKTTVSALTDFLQDPHTVRPAGRMPSFRLTEPQSRAIAAWLLRDQAGAGARQPVAGIRWERFAIGPKQEKLPDFSKLKKTGEGVTGQIDMEAIAGKGPFALRFTGELVLAESWDYTFSLTSDDGSRLIIDGRTVVEHDGQHAATTKSGNITLQAGRYPFELQYFDVGNGQVLNVEWRRQAGEQGPLTADMLQHYPSIAMKAPAHETRGDAAAIRRGQAAFSKYGCAACHQLPGQENQLKAPALAAVRTGSGCLAPAVRSGVDYQLDERQRSQLSMALANAAQLNRPRPAAAEAQQQLARFNCLACHARGGSGGPGETREALFTSVFEVDIGQMAHLPPNLGRVGEKLTAAALQAVITGQGPYVRPHLRTRMPTFSDDCGKALTAALRAADARPDTDVLPELSGDPYHESVAAGKQLFGGGGLNCATCHNFGSQPGGMNILNLMTVKERLTPGGFRSYLSGPIAFHNDRMPPFWPSIGDTQMAVPLPNLPKMTAREQQEAVYRYLLTAKDDGPKVKAANELLPRTETIVFRTFMEGVSPRTIAVGHPGSVNVAFDADQVRLAQAWRGRFFLADGTWEGRAGKFLPPLSEDRLVLPPGPAFVSLPDPNAVWPVPEKHTRNVGGHFLGYRLDAAREPVFRYRVNGIVVEEQPLAEAGLSAKLIRRFTLLPSASGPGMLTLRAAIGSRITADGDFFKVAGAEGIRLRPGQACSPSPGLPATAGAKPAELTPRVRQSAAGAELLIDVPVNDTPVYFEMEVSW